MARKPTIGTGYSSNGLPFVRIEGGQGLLVHLEALSFQHEPKKGMELTAFIKQVSPLLSSYTVLSIGRKPRMPESYTYRDMIEDYAEMVRTDLGGRSVDLYGISTGGQLALGMAIEHPDLVNSLVLVSAAYRLSETGVAIERESATWFEKGQTGRSLAALVTGMLRPGIGRRMNVGLVRMLGGAFLGKIDTPQDFLLEVKADREMNFFDQLRDIRAPTFLGCGEEDKFYSVEDVKITAENIPSCTLKLYPDYGHDLSMRHMKAVMRDVVSFLQTHGVVAELT